MFQKEIGIDIGTANILVYSKSKGIVFNQPTVVAYDKNSKKIISIGQKAKDMIGKNPKNIEVIRPLKGGVIADFDITSEMVQSILKTVAKITGTSLRKPTVIAAVPYGSTTVDNRAIIDAIRHAGAKSVHLIEEPIAAAIGAGLSVNEPVANTIVNMGAGTTEAAIISLGGIVTCQSIKVGGDHLDEAILQYVRKKYKLLIGQKTAEQIKIEIGYALIDHEEEKMEIRGRDLISGLPETVTLSSLEISEAIKEPLLSMLTTIQGTLENCPAELSGDIVDLGVTLTGGGALLKGMTNWLSDELKVPVHLAESPLECVAIGAGKTLSNIKQIQKVQ